MGWKSEKEILQKAFGEESKSSQIVIRVTESMAKALEAEAEETGQAAADIARTAISMYLIPGFLKKRLDSGIGLESKDRLLVEVFRKFLSQLNDICNQVEGKQKGFEMGIIEQNFDRLLKNPLFQERLEYLARRMVAAHFKEKQPKKSNRRKPGGKG